MEKYHVALSFAGEDRIYVDQVANELKGRGVDVFYDKFEEANLWGKNLYTYLRDVYKNRALYTVIFVSEAYKNKLWTNHERESAQARAFEESREYVLPAVFDDTIEIPGILKTTGYINIKNKKPSKFAELIIKKLESDGIELSPDLSFNYSLEAKSDVDFPIYNNNTVSGILNRLRSHDWYKQGPAILEVFSMDWDSTNLNELFVLGRNIYQSACGSERNALYIVKNLRKEMAKIPIHAAEHIVNGMFYEVYFDSEGNYRGNELKSRCLSHLISIQTVDKYSRCIFFIRNVLAAYKDNIAIMPNQEPEIIEILAYIKKKEQPVIDSMVFRGKELIVDIDKNEESYNRLWTLSYRPFTLKRLEETITSEFHIPSKQLLVKFDSEISEDTTYILPAGKTIKQIP